MIRVELHQSLLSIAYLNGDRRVTFESRPHPYYPKWLEVWQRDLCSWDPPYSQDQIDAEEIGWIHRRVEQEIVRRGLTPVFLRVATYGHGEQVLDSRRGYRIAVWATPVSLTYLEHDRRLSFGAEFVVMKQPQWLSTQRTIEVYHAQPRWDPPLDQVQISPEEYHRIAVRVLDGLREMGHVPFFGSDRTGS